eukprot:SAG11_NODE_25019_length_364_cov_1.943396_1_plen_73_part_10
MVREFAQMKTFFAEGVVGGMQSLRTLTLEDNPRLERLPSDLAQLKQMETVRLGGCTALVWPAPYETLVPKHGT